MISMSFTRASSDQNNPPITLFSHIIEPWGILLLENRGISHVQQLLAIDGNSRKVLARDLHMNQFSHRPLVGVEAQLYVWQIRIRSELFGKEKKEKKADAVAVKSVRVDETKKPPPPITKTTRKRWTMNNHFNSHLPLINFKHSNNIHPPQACFVENFLNKKQLLESPDALLSCIEKDWDSLLQTVRDECDSSAFLEQNDEEFCVRFVLCILQFYRIRMCFVANNGDEMNLACDGIAKCEAKVQSSLNSMERVLMKGPSKKEIQEFLFSQWIFSSSQLSCCIESADQWLNDLAEEYFLFCLYRNYMVPFRFCTEAILRLFEVPESTGLPQSPFSLASSFLWKNILAPDEVYVLEFFVEKKRNPYQLLLEEGKKKYIKKLSEDLSLYRSGKGMRGVKSTQVYVKFFTMLALRIQTAVSCPPASKKDREWLMDPCCLINDLGRKFLEEKSLLSFEKFLAERTVDLAADYDKFRLARGMPELKGKGALACVSQWKGTLREYVELFEVSNDFNWKLIDEVFEIFPKMTPSINENQNEVSKPQKTRGTKRSRPNSCEDADERSEAEMMCREDPIILSSLSYTSPNMMEITFPRKSSLFPFPTMLGTSRGVPNDLKQKNAHHRNKKQMAYSKNGSYEMVESNSRDYSQVNHIVNPYVQEQVPGFHFTSAKLVCSLVPTEVKYTLDSVTPSANDAAYQSDRMSNSESPTTLQHQTKMTNLEDNSIFPANFNDAAGSIPAVNDVSHQEDGLSKFERSPMLKHQTNFVDGEAAAVKDVSFVPLYTNTNQGLGERDTQNITSEDDSTKDIHYPKKPTASDKSGCGHSHSKLSEEDGICNCNSSFQQKIEVYHGRMEISRVPKKYRLTDEDLLKALQAPENTLKLLFEGEDDVYEFLKSVGIATVFDLITAKKSPNSDLVNNLYDFRDGKWQPHSCVRVLHGWCKKAKIFSGVDPPHKNFPNVLEGRILSDEDLAAIAEAKKATAKAKREKKKREASRKETNTVPKGKKVRKKCQSDHREVPKGKRELMNAAKVARCTADPLLCLSENSRNFLETQGITTAEGLFDAKPSELAVFFNEYRKSVGIEPLKPHSALTTISTWKGDVKKWVKPDLKTAINDASNDKLTENDEPNPSKKVQRNERSVTTAAVYPIFTITDLGEREFTAIDDQSDTYCFTCQDEVIQYIGASHGLDKCQVSAKMKSVEGLLKVGMILSSSLCHWTRGNHFLAACHRFSGEIALKILPTNKNGIVRRDGVFRGKKDFSHKGDRFLCSTNMKKSRFSSMIKFENNFATLVDCTLLAKFLVVVKSSDDDVEYDVFLPLKMEYGQAIRLDLGTACSSRGHKWRQDEVDREIAKLTTLIENHNEEPMIQDLADALQNNGVTRRDSSISIDIVSPLNPSMFAQSLPESGPLFYFLRLGDKICRSTSDRQRPFLEVLPESYKHRLTRHALAPMDEEIPILPVAVNLESLLDGYKIVYPSKAKMVELFREYFNTAILSLLSDKEKSQFLHFTKYVINECSPTKVYGLEHALRLAYFLEYKKENTEAEQMSPIRMFFENFFNYCFNYCEIPTQCYQSWEDYKEFSCNSSQVVLKEEDEGNLTRYTYLTMQQLKCIVTTSDVEIKAGTVPVGSPALQCKWCAQVDPALLTGRCNTFLNFNVDSLAASITPVAFEHIIRCQFVPAKIREDLSIFKEMHGEERKSLGRGSQIAFYRQLWDRMQNFSMVNRDMKGEETRKAQLLSAKLNSSVKRKKKFVSGSSVSDRTVHIGLVDKRSALNDSKHLDLIESWRCSQSDILSDEKFNCHLDLYYECLKYMGGKLKNGEDYGQLDSVVIECMRQRSC